EYSGARRELPSFPTRRSSDLAPAVERSQAEHELSELERLREVVVGAELEPGGLVVETVGSGEHEERHAAAGGDDDYLTKPFELRDRKSTRLNSSHVAISYAVF